MRTCPAPWGMSAQEHTFTFCQIFFISGGNYTLITCIQYTTMVTHSECERSQSWRTQFSSHGALNLNRAVMPPLPLPLANQSAGVLERWLLSLLDAAVFVHFAIVIPALHSRPSDRNKIWHTYSDRYGTDSNQKKM